MKQVGIRLEEELIQKAKIFALQRNITFQDLVSSALNLYIGGSIIEKQAQPQPKINQEPVKKEEKPKPEPKKAPSTTNELFPDYIDTGEPLELMETIATGAKVYRTERRDHRGYRILVIKDKDENGEETAYEDIDYYDKI